MDLLIKDNIVDGGTNVVKLKITPEVATELLKGNYCNRKLSDKKVTTYAQQMQRGEWNCETTETIKLTKTMRLIDGQHRLHAIKLSGKTQELYVAHDVPEDTINVIDTGMKRSVSNIFELNGIENSALVSAIIKKAISFGVAKSINFSIRNYTAIEVLQHYNKNPEKWQEIAKAAQKFHKNFKFVEISVLGAWYAMAAKNDEEIAKSFFNQLSSGVGLKEKHPILLLREYLIKEKTKKDSLQYKHVLFIKAWNNWKAGNMMSIIRYNPNETFPKLNA